MRKELIVYHRVDLDGVFSEAVVHSRLESDVDSYGFTYGDPEPPIDEWCYKYDRIWMVDISFPPNIMLYLKEHTRELIWIDHHVTAIKDSEQWGYSDLFGKRQIGKAACELSWEFVNPKDLTPEIIRLLSTYDVWDHERFNWNDVVVPFELAIYNDIGLDIEKAKDLLMNTPSIPTEIEKGKVILKYIRSNSKTACEQFAFEISIDGGKKKALCLLGTDFSSRSFSGIDCGDKLMCIVNRLDSDKYRISLYGGETNLGDFSCGEYMKKYYSGGGHKGAAGGFLNFKQFKRLIQDREL